ncbi:hypothetical protein EDD86DRAFT_195119 [Gorgonomyces haynaldii]|nr:hypothetical protein EDD86DRAFT_195119 [Gorgonomyces haynaldii]
MEYPKYQDELGHCSLESLEEYQNTIRQIKKEALVLRYLTEEEQQEAVFLTSAVDQALAGTQCLNLEIPTTHFTGFVPELSMTLQDYTPLKTVKDVSVYISRLEKVPILFDEIIEAFRQGMQSGRTLPRDCVLLLGNMCSDIAETPVDKSPFALDLSIVKTDSKILYPIILEYVYPAYSKLSEFLLTEYVEKSRSTPGLYGIPDSQEIYKRFIFKETCSEHDPLLVHELGLQEVARIDKRMQQVQQLIHQGTRQEFHQAIGDKSKYPHLHLERDEILSSYRSTLLEIEQVLPKYFNKFPKFRCRIEPVPAYGEATMPFAYYQTGTETQPGCFRVNLRLCETKGIHQSVALILHEGVPGHHHQFSLDFEKPTHVMHKIIQCTAYMEGWALYCEYLGEEMGLYKDPMFLYGRLQFEMHRALRLVVDTGLHCKGWSLQECLEYMKQYLTLSDTEIEAELNRYCIMPAQALSYKIGEIGILKLRQEAEQALGHKFKLKQFHDVVLDHGSVSMSVLAQNVRNWIKKC